MNTVTLKSVDTSAKLIFSNVNGDYFQVTYTSPAIKFSKEIWGYTDSEIWLMNAKFMSENWKGWEDEVLLESIEGDLRIAFKTDKLGHVSVVVKVSDSGGNEPWVAEAELFTNTPLMLPLYNDLKEFFG